MKKEPVHEKGEDGPDHLLWQMIRKIQRRLPPGPEATGDDVSRRRRVLR